MECAVLALTTQAKALGESNYNFLDRRDKNEAELEMQRIFKNATMLRAKSEDKIADMETTDDYLDRLKHKYDSVRPPYEPCSTPVNES